MPDEPDEQTTRGDAPAGSTDAPAPGPARRRPTPAASAASRARRIGGARTSGEPRGAGEGTARSKPTSKAGSNVAAGSAGASTEASSVSVAKSTSKPASAGPKGRSGPSDSTPVIVTQAPAWLRWVPALVLAACAIAMAVVLAVTAHGVWYAKPSSDQLRDQVLAAAKTCTAATNTYSYGTIAKDEANGVRCTTGQWKSQYQQAFTTLVIPQATKLKASQSIQINDAGIESISQSGKQWEVVVYGQTKITQAKAKSRQDPFAAVVRMDHVGGKWLISHIDTVNKASS